MNMMRLFSRGSGESPQPSSSSSSEASPSPPSPASTTGPARPIRLVYCDEKGKFRMDPEAVAMLQLVKEPVGVVSVCGRARQGKSFVLNQMGGIDEAALDRLSLVTEMTKHIRVRASGGRTTTSELGQFSPIFVWLLRDFYLDLVEDNRKITPRDYLELALKPVQGSGRDIAAKNEIRESVRALFPDRECFTLVRPLSNENELQRLDQIHLDKLRPEFRSGLDAFTKFVFERTRPKQVGATVMTGPILARITQSFLDAINNGAVPTITSSWQSVEEAECQRAYDLACEVYMASFDRSKPPEEAALREAHDEAVQKSTAAFNDSAVGSGSTRQKYEKRLHNFLRKAFEVLGCSITLLSWVLGRDVGGVQDELAGAESITAWVVRLWLILAKGLEVRNLSGAFFLLLVIAGMIVQQNRGDACFCLVKDDGAQSYRGCGQEFVGVDYKRDAFREAYLQCSNAIQNMEKELRSACHAPDAKIDRVLKILDDLVSKYEKSPHGPEKWRKLAGFLKQSLEGPVVDLIKKQIDQIVSEKSSLMLKCRSIEDKMGLLNKQLEASEKYKSEYLKRYEDAINDKKKLADDYMSRIANLQSKCSSLEERCSSLSKTLDLARQESVDWKRKYEQVLSKQKAEEDQASSEIAILKSRSSAAEARLAAAREQSQSSQEEAEEWKRKYDIAVREAKAALEKAAVVQERSSKQTQLREDALREEFSSTLAEKEDELKDKASKIEFAEQRLTTLSLELKAAESKIKNYDSEISTLKIEIKELAGKLETANGMAQSFEQEARILEQEKLHLEQKYQSEFNRFEEVQDRCRNAEREAKRATELADKARAEAVTSQKEKSEIQRTAMERLAQIERAERRIESLERQKADLANEADRYRAAEADAVSKVLILEARVEEREKEIESLLQSNNEQRLSTVQVLESLLAQSARHARKQIIGRKRSQFTYKRHKGNLTRSSRMGVESVHDMDNNNGEMRGNKRSKSTTSPLKPVQPEDGGSVFKGDEENDNSQQTNSEDYTKFTVQRLKQELTKHNFGGELLQLKNPNKKDIISLYEKCVIQKS
ncbi:hypothetical protein C3L33_06201, partial [Rhododendron williamsianum]